MQKDMANNFEKLNGLSVRTGFILSNTESNGRTFNLENNFRIEYQAGEYVN
jgi:hypothetical protein